ncbi:MAG: TrkA family potassium uptake protein [Pirellula sp.]|jgi:trk system potassium uptake protein TrkA|nr:TrkA family potassium uptake protein [Pirellula sp.]
MAKKYKRFVVIGLGNFGFAACQKLSNLGHEVIAVDVDPAVVDRIGPIVERAAALDATDTQALKRLGVEGADAAVVSTGDDITASILASLALQDLKVREIFVKVISTDHARVMERLGVTETVFPERDTATALANKISGNALRNYIALGANFSIQEMGVPQEWLGRSIGELGVRQKYDVTIIAIHDILTDAIVATPGPDYKLKESDTIFVAGNDQSLKRIAAVD